MSLTQPGALQLPSNQQLRSVVLSYLLYHGHKDTARVFAAEITRREDAESVEQCPLWKPQGYTSNVGNHMSVPEDVTLSHALLPEQDADRLPANAVPSAPNRSDDASYSRNKALESVLVDVEARRKIRYTLLSGKIEDAIDLIAHHLPGFLPIDLPAGRTQPTKRKPQLGSHDSSALTSSLPSSASPILSLSRSPTPVSSPPQTATVPEKALQKSEMPVTSTSGAGSPELVDSNEPLTQAHSSRSHNSPSLARSVDPVHILFNLRVQQFVEAVRTVPLPPSTEECIEGSPRQEVEPTKPEGSNVDVEMCSPDSDTAGYEYISIRHNGVTRVAQADLSPEARQKRLFELASGLYQNVATLTCESERDVYGKEVEQVCSLMLGPSPESSLAAPYLSLSRRESLADQVNSAMLWHVGEPPAPRLQIWAQTTKVAWDQVKAIRPTLHKGTEIPADVRMYTKYVVRNTEGDEQQGQSQTVVPFDFHALAQA